MGRPVNPSVPEDGFKSKKTFLDTGSIDQADFAVTASTDSSKEIMFDPSNQTHGKTVTIAAGGNTQDIILTLPSVSGGLGPAGADKQLQFNDSGAFGVSANITYDKTAKQVKLGDGTASNPFAFSGLTTDVFINPSDSKDHEISILSDQGGLSFYVSGSDNTPPQAFIGSNVAGQPVYLMAGAGVVAASFQSDGTISVGDVDPNVHPNQTHDTFRIQSNNGQRALVVTDENNDDLFILNHDGSLVTRGSINLNGYSVTNGTVAYSPATPTNWNGTAPTTVQAALDRCAALLKTLNGGTGP
jgi:hypothetical protein